MNKADRWFATLPGLSPLMQRTFLRMSAAKWTMRQAALTRSSKPLSLVGLGTVGTKSSTPAPVAGAASGIKSTSQKDLNHGSKLLSRGLQKVYANVIVATWLDTFAAKSLPMARECLNVHVALQC